MMRNGLEGEDLKLFPEEQLLLRRSISQIKILWKMFQKNRAFFKLTKKIVNCKTVLLFRTFAMKKG